MVHTLRFFSLQIAVCYIIPTYLVPVIFTFYIQGVLKLKKNNSGAKRLNTEINILRCMVSKTSKKNYICLSPYSGRTAPLNSKRFILYIYSTNIGNDYFKHGIYYSVFSLQIAICFIMLTYLVRVIFTFYIQGVLKLKKNNSGAIWLNTEINILRCTVSKTSKKNTSTCQ